MLIGDYLRYYYTSYDEEIFHASKNHRYFLDLGRVKLKSTIYDRLETSLPRRRLHNWKRVEFNRESRKQMHFAPREISKQEEHRASEKIPTTRLVYFGIVSGNVFRKYAIFSRLIISILFTIRERVLVRLREFLRCPTSRMWMHLVTRVGYYSRTRVAVSMIMPIIVSTPRAFVIFFFLTRKPIRGLCGRGVVGA